MITRAFRHEADHVTRTTQKGMPPLVSTADVLENAETQHTMDNRAWWHVQWAINAATGEDSAPARWISDVDDCRPYPNQRVAR